MAEKIPGSQCSTSTDSSPSLNEEDVEASSATNTGGLFTRVMGDGYNYAHEASPDDENDRPPSRHSLRDPLRHDVEARGFSSRDGANAGVLSMAVSGTMGGDNYAYEASPDDEDDIQPRRRDTSDNDDEVLRLTSRDEADARAHFMAVSRPPVYQRSVSEGFYRESEDPCKNYILMSPLSSGGRQTASNSLIDETGQDMELAEETMLGATGGDVIPARRFFAPNRYEESNTSTPRMSLQSRASDIRYSVDPLKSARSSTLSSATTVSDEQRRNRATITPLLDDYFRNRSTAIVADNPAPSDRANLVDNEAQGDSSSQGPQEEAAAAPAERGCMANYYKVTKRIINSPFMFLIYIPLACWSIYCIHEGFKYMRLCPTTDTLPIIFVFLGLTSLFASLTRMLHIVARRSAAYPTISNMVQCLQTVMFLGYFFIYILELTSFFIMELESLSEECAGDYFSFTYWNTWLQMPVIAVMILLHTPAAYRSKWYCGRATERLE